MSNRQTRFDARLAAGLTACGLLALAAIGGCSSRASKPSGTKGDGTTVTPTTPPAPPPSPPPAQPGIVFALLDPGEPSESIEAYARLATVDGIAFRSLWSTLEPSDGVYRWTALDAAFDAARRQSKRLTLHVAASLPGWLAAAGARTYQFSTPIGSGTAPIPWDGVYLNRYGAFLSALAAHIRDRGDDTLLQAVSIGVPVSEMSIPGCTSGRLSPSESYDRAAYLQAWKTSIDQYSTAFPATPLYISAPVSVICLPDNDGRAFYREVMEYGLSRTANVTVFVADLNALGSARMAQVDTTILPRTKVAMQTIWSFSNDPSNRMQGPLRDAVCAGRRAGARYFELYKADLDSTDATTQAAVKAARTGDGC